MNNDNQPRQGPVQFRLVADAQFENVQIEITQSGYGPLCTLSMPADAFANLADLFQQMKQRIEVYPYTKRFRDN